MDNSLITEAKIKIYENTNRPLIVKVIGNSMMPLICENDTVHVRKKQRYKPGDILLFRYRSGLIVHRLLFIRKNLFHLKGDNCVNIEKVRLLDIIGCVFKAEAPGREINIKRPFALILIIPLSYFIYFKWKRTGNYEKIMKGKCLLIINKLVQKSYLK